MKKEQLGYSSSPLFKKLGIKQCDKIRIVNSPANYLEFLGQLPAQVELSIVYESNKNLIHYFASSMFQLEREILLLKSEILKNGIIWISWCKKTSKIQTDVTEDKIRELALKSGLVNVKVCSIDEKWSALKLVIPIKYRTK